MFKQIKGIEVSWSSQDDLVKKQRIRRKTSTTILKVIVPRFAELKVEAQLFQLLGVLVEILTPTIRASSHSEDQICVEAKNSEVRTSDSKQKRTIIRLTRAGLEA